MIARNAMFVVGLLMAFGPAQAAEPTAQMPPDRFIAGKSVAAVPMAAWEDGGKVRTASGKDAVAKAPKNAVRYEMKKVTFPTGTMRVLKFKKADGGVLHPIGDETEMIVISGAADVTVA